MSAVAERWRHYKQKSHYSWCRRWGDYYSFDSWRGRRHRRHRNNRATFPVIGITSAPASKLLASRVALADFCVLRSTPGSAFRQQGAGSVAAVAGGLQSDLGYGSPWKAASPYPRIGNFETPPLTPVRGRQNEQSPESECFSGLAGA